MAARAPTPTGGARRAVGALLFTLIYLQKFGLTVSADLQFSIPMLFYFLLMPVMLLRSQAVIDGRRLCLYLTFLAAVLASQVLASSTPSISSLMQLLLLYLPFVLVCRLEREDIAALFRLFSTLMILPALLVLVQYAYQLAHGAGTSLGINPYVPSQFLLQGYMYESSTENWITYNRPNGMVFLEPSFCSAFLASAIILELCTRVAKARILLFSVALVACAGATGMVMLGVALPLIALRRAPATTLILASLAGVLVLVLLWLGVDLPMTSRIEELGSQGASGNARLMLPFERLFDLLVDPSLFFSGHGAGSITAQAEQFGAAWALLKMMYEYGILAAFLYLLLFISSADGQIPLALKVALCVIFHLTGGYLLSPILVPLIFAFCVVTKAPEQAIGATRARAIFGGSLMAAR
ncbi:hypothetical protein [Muricoccus radiodurans]|uniref:hypothetical protein n=1 Tax=Muricoccus radiodurans TaxID=2231721 RepID=UPI003CF54325